MICRNHARRPFPARFQFRYNLKMTLPLRIQLLGTFQVLQNGRSLTTFRTDKIRGLLAYLAVEADRPHRRESLATLFWPEMDSQKSLSNLRLSLHRLRQTLGDDNGVLQIERQSVQFDTTKTWVDVLQFTQAITAVSTHAHTQPETCTPCMTHLETAVAHYYGDFLPGFFLEDDLPFSEWVTNRREGLHLQALQAFAWLTHYYQGNGQIEQAITYARRQLELEPWDETAHQQMMRGLAATGHHTAALEQYETCCRILLDELGVDPSPETTMLYEQIKEGQIPTHQATQSSKIHSPPSSDLHPVLLSTPFIGREDELASLNKLLSDPVVRLITILGAGGMGKTRLAQICLEGQVNHFLHGVYFVRLTAVTRSDQILPAIAKSIAFAPDQNEKTRSANQQLLDHLQTRQILLVLDNFEQLLDGEQKEASTAVLIDLLENTTHAKLLITSRERLHSQIEYVFPLRGLPCPQADMQDINEYTAVQLFQQSAQRLQPDFALTADDLPHLIAICQLLDGMPLGLELAAAWVDLLPLAEIATEIQNSLDFLAIDMHDIPARHRSMRAVFDASWARLSQPEQDLFQQLSLFRSGFTRASIQVIAGHTQKHTTVLRLLSALVSKSLLRYDRRADRYSLHELLRQYGAEKLTDETILTRYGRYYCNWLAEQSSALKGDRQKATLDAIEADIDNIQAAWNWAVNHQDLSLLSEGTFSLGMFFYRQGRHEEGQLLFSEAAAVVAKMDNTINQLTLAQLNYWQAMFEPAVGQRQSWLQAALTLLETAVIDPPPYTEQAAILLELGIVAFGQGYHDRADQYFGRSLTHCRLAGDRWGEANVLCELGVSAWSRGDYAEAMLRYAQSLAIRQALQDHIGMAVALEGLAGTAMFTSNNEQAIAYTQQSLAVYRQLEDPVGTAVLQAELGHKNWYQNLTGIELIEDSLRIFADLGTRRHLAHWTVILAMYKADVDIIAAKQLAEEGLSLCQAIGYQRGVAIAYGVLSRAAWMAEAYDQAQELAQVYLQLTEAMSLPLERSDALTWSAWAYLATGQWVEAECQIKLILQTPNLWRVASLNLAAILLTHRSPKQCEWAWQLLGYGECKYGRHRGAVSQQMISRFMPATMRAIPQQRITQLKKQGQKLDAETIFPELLTAFA